MENDFSYEDRLNVPYMEKQKGDKFLKENNLDEALKAYSKAIMALKVLFQDKSLDQEMMEKYVREAGIPSNLNLSFIYIKQKQWSTVIACCNKVLEVENNNTKALYRRCLAFINTNNFEKADKDLEILEDLIGGTNELEILEKMFEDKKKEVKNSEDQIYKRMFKKYVTSNIKI